MSFSTNGQDEAERTSTTRGELIMFRKISIALVAAAALGTAALAPTSASAWGRGGGFHGGGFHRDWGFGHRGYGYGYDSGPGWCYFHPYRCERPL
jgi:hypothetical protein